MSGERVHHAVAFLAWFILGGYATPGT
ncbi:YoaK family small membrane protein [Klebsiella pneumoniae]